MPGRGVQRRARTAPAGLSRPMLGQTARAARQPGGSADWGRRGGCTLSGTLHGWQAQWERTSLGGTLFRPRLVSLAWMTGHTCRAGRTAQRGRPWSLTTAERQRGARPGRHPPCTASRTLALSLSRRPSPSSPTCTCLRERRALHNHAPRHTAVATQRGLQPAPAAERAARGGQRTVCVALGLHAHPPRVRKVVFEPAR